MKSRKKEQPFVHYLAMWGCFSTGIVYAAIGVIAILSFLKLKEGGADEGSLLVYLNKYLIGRVFIWIIMLGMISYIIWRIYETIYDPYKYGKKIIGIIKRSAIALSGLADAMIAYSAVQALFDFGGTTETGQPTAQRGIVSNILNEPWGSWAVLIIGIIISITAIAQLAYIISSGYRERLTIDHLSRWKKMTIHVLAWVGHFARAVILGIIGFFFIKAAITENAQHVVNTDKAFDFIGDDVGHFYFIAIAAATICYGFFMFAFGFFYDSDKD
jgi:hypothetical protein